MSQDSYTRAARLVYIARYTIDGPKPALIQAHRRAASAVAAHPDDDDAAVQEALRSAIDEIGAWRSSRGLFGGPRLAPVAVTEDQRKVLDQIKALDYRVAVAALLHLLEDVAVEDLAVVLGSEKSSYYQESVREAVVSLCGGRTTEEVRDLLLGRELDPMIVPVSAQATLKRRRRRVRAGSVVTAVVVAMAAAGVWWFGVRVPPLGSYAGDPQLQTQSLIYETSYGLNAWPARGELLGDAALLRRAADAWRAHGLPSGKRPRVLFAGRIHDVEVVVLTNDDLNGSDLAAAVYAEGLRDKELNAPTPGDTRILVNPYPDDPAGPGAIRLMDSPAFQADPIGEGRGDRALGHAFCRVASGSSRCPRRDRSPGATQDPATATGFRAGLVAVRRDPLQGIEQERRHGLVRDGAGGLRGCRAAASRDRERLPGPSGPERG